MKKLKNNENTLLIRYFKGLKLSYDKMKLSYQLSYNGRMYYASSELDHAVIFWKEEVKRIFGFDTHRNLLDGRINKSEMITYKKWFSEVYMNETK